MILDSEFKKMKFATYGLVERKERPAYRLPQGFVMHQDKARLRNMMSNLVNGRKAKLKEEKTNKKVTIENLIEIDCAIPYDTYRKHIGGRSPMSRKILAKFCVGLKLSLEEADELFELHSGKLNLTNDFDCVVYYALKTQDNIDDFIAEMKEKVGVDLNSVERKDSK